MNSEVHKTVLATAYAINPYKGSEDGMGWNMINEMARHHRVIAITRENNRFDIEKFMAANPSDCYQRIQFAYFDLPYWMRFWKKGGRGAMIYYYMWQWGIVSFIRRQGLEFDIVHNLNFHNDWTPSFLWRLGKPMVWGPVGHHPLIPKAFLKDYGVKALIKDRLTWGIKNFFWKFDPFLNITKSRASKILAMNDSVAPVLKVNSDKLYKLPSVGSEGIETVPTFSKKKFTVLSVGRFVPLKGFDVAIRSFAGFYRGLPPADQSEVQLILVGKGPEEQLLKAMVKQEAIGDAVRFIRWIERSELLKIYQQADVFFFPSHEGAGMVVVEAMSIGVPVLCFDNCGPGEIIDEKSGLKVPYGQYDECVRAFAQKLKWLYEHEEERQALARGAQIRHKQKFLWENKAKAFKEVYRDL